MLQYQRGAVSLLWAAVFVGSVASMAMVALLSARHERNYFAEVWQYLSSGAGQKLQQAVQTPSVPGHAGVRKCTVAGKVVYSNVECDKSNPTSQEVALQETKGFEPPKPAPVVPGQPGMEPSPQERAIEKILGR
ncbi:MAG TPA: hypothetical protein VFF81_09955 [Noviherbaspirillum sp.]|nr:hypothetical protein [Noviherbaspirillum sp.]